MSKAVLVSIRPEWCEKIASGKKTVEVRKTCPKLPTPFKCYIYRTLPKSGDWCEKDGKVIGEFVCDKIGEAHWMQDFGYAAIYKEWDDVADCLTNQQIYDYMGENDILFGWHISEPKIYDTPKELREFLKPCVDKYQYCQECEHGFVKYPTWVETREDLGGVCFDTECLNTLTRPPQSWCYVEEMS